MQRILLALDSLIPIIPAVIFFSFFQDFIYLFMRDTEKERQRHRQREKQAPRRELDAGPDPITADHAVSQRQMLNRYATQAFHLSCILKL